MWRSKDWNTSSEIILFRKERRQKAGNYGPISPTSITRLMLAPSVAKIIAVDLEGESEPVAHVRDVG